MSILRGVARPAVAGTAAALLLLAGCGGDDDTDASSSSSPSSTSSSSSSSSAAQETDDSETTGDAPDFCEAFLQLGDLEAAVASLTPDQYGQFFQDAADAFAQVDPPAEVAADWQALGDGFQQIADTLTGVDLTSAEGALEAQQALTDFATVATTASTNLGTYAATNCAAG